jgi:hypothetical protein
MVDYNKNAKTPSIVDGKLYNLENITAAELASWIEQTTSDPGVIRMLREAAAILQAELDAEGRP